MTATQPVAQTQAPVVITPELLEQEFPAFDGQIPPELPVLITDFLPEGNLFFGSLAGTIKTWASLSIAKALTTGTPLWGVFEVPEKVAVLYLIPEAADADFNMSRRESRKQWGLWPGNQPRSGSDRGRG